MKRLYKLMDIYGDAMNRVSTNKTEIIFQKLMYFYSQLLKIRTFASDFD